MRESVPQLTVTRHTDLFDTFSNGWGQPTRQRTFESGMNRGHDPLLAIGEQHWQAVGSVDRHRARPAAYHAIRLAAFGWDVLDIGDHGRAVALMSIGGISGWWLTGWLQRRFEPTQPIAEWRAPDHGHRELTVSG